MPTKSKTKAKRPRPKRTPPKRATRTPAPSRPDDVAVLPAAPARNGAAVGATLARRIGGALRSAAPPLRVPVSVWANAHRVLSKRASAEPGKFQWERAPYQREMMDALSDPDVDEVVFMVGSQLGKTEIINTVLGYYIAVDPAPILVVQPTVDLAEAWSKDRLAPMLEATPVLARLVSDPKSRDSENTILHKVFVGGTLTAVGANAPSSLAMRPIRILLCDEVDRFPASAGSEGDPIALASRRTDTFWNRRRLYVSTPTTKGASRIEEAYQASDQRSFFVPCPRCGHRQVLTWPRVVYARDDSGHVVPESVAYLCEGCERPLTEGDKAGMLAGGVWVPKLPGRRVRGYHLSALFSPWRTWADIAEEWSTVNRNPERLKVFVNTVLAETWEERGDGVKSDNLRARQRAFDAEVPDGVGMLVGAVDVQGDRLEAIVVGFGAGEQSWVVAFTQVLGDPAQPRVWHDLTAFLSRGFTCASGRQAHVEVAVVDSGGAHTDEVYRYCAAALAEGRRVYPVKGASTAGRPLVERPSTTNRYKVPLFVLGVDAGKETVLARLQVPAPGPGFINLPDWLDGEFIDQLTAEKAVRKYVRGRGSVRVWQKTRERNEAFDLMVYALAALKMSGDHTVATLGDRAEALSARPDPGKAQAEPTPEGVEAQPIRPHRPPGGWVNAWRR